MRFPSKTARVVLLTALLGAQAAPLAAEQMPGFDFMTMDFGELRFALSLSPGLRAPARTLNMTATLALKDAPESVAPVPLTLEQTSEGAAALKEEVGADRVLLLARLTAESQARLDALRQQIRELRRSGKHGSLNLQAASEEICLEPEAETPPRLDLYMTSSAAEGFIALARDVDLDIQRARNGHGPIPPCD